TQQWDKLVEPPGEARADLWQIVELARRLGHGGLFEYGTQPLERALYEEYRRFTVGTGKDLAPYDLLKETHGGVRWPYVDGREVGWRSVEGEVPYLKQGTAQDV